MTALAELKAQYRQKMGDVPDPVGTDGGTEAPALAELEAKRDELVARLHKGWELVGPGGPGETDSRLHDHFAELLRGYEAACDEITALTAWEPAAA